MGNFLCNFGDFFLAKHTDEELANIARLETINAKTILTIKNIGQKKVDKYGEKLIKAFVTIDADLDFLNQNNI